MGFPLAALGDFISPDAQIKREAEKRRGMDIIMTSPDDERYNVIRPSRPSREAEKRSAMDIIMTSPNDERYNVIRPY